MRSEYKKLLKNTGLLAIGSFASSLLGMFLTPLYTSILSTTDYGISDLVSTSTSLLFPFASVAISQSIMRFSLDKASNKPSIYSSGLYTVLLGSLVLLPASFPIISQTVLAAYYHYFVLYYLSYAFHVITSYFVQGLEQVRIYSISGLLNTVIVIGCNILFLLVLNWGVEGYLLSFIIGHLTATVFLFFAARLYKHVVLPWKIDRALYKKMLRFSLPVIPHSVSWWIANSSDKYILTYFAGAAAVGVYSVSYKIPSIIMTVMGFFTSAWQLSAVEDFGSEKSKQFFAGVYNKCVVINVLLAAALIVTAKPFGYVLYAKEFFEAWHYVPVLIIANVFNVLAMFLGSVYTAAKRTKMLAVSTVAGALGNIVLNFVLIPFMGALGAAIATAAAYVLMWIIRVINTRKLLAFPIDFKRDIMLFIVLIALTTLVLIDHVIAYVAAWVLALALVVFFRRVLWDIVKTLLQSVTARFKGNS